MEDVGFGDDYVITPEIRFFWDAYVSISCFPVKNKCLREVLPQLMGRVS